LIATGTWKVIDFGLARRFVDESGATIPQRMEAAFRGSTTYASINAHKQLDLGRRDDVWSWLYCLVELLSGAS
jgi:tau tubulin kinase